MTLEIPTPVPLEQKSSSVESDVSSFCNLSLPEFSPFGLETVCYEESEDLPRARPLEKATMFHESYDNDSTNRKVEENDYDNFDFEVGQFLRDAMFDITDIL